MSDNRAIKDVYDEGMLEIQRVLGSVNSTGRQRRVARQSLKDLTSMLIAHTLKNVEGRTALLAGLIVELNEVIESIQVKPPYMGAIDKVTKVAKKARKLFTGVKKKLI